MFKKTKTTTSLSVVLWMATAIILSTSPALSQSFLDDYCLLTTKYAGNIEQDIDKGFRAFVVDSVLTRQDVNIIHRLLEGDSIHPFVLFNLNNHSQFTNQITSSALSKHINTPSGGNPWGIIIQPGKNLYIFTHDQGFLDFNTHILRYPDSPDTLPQWLTWFDAYSLPPATSIYQIQTYLQKNGRLPNIILTDNATNFRPLTDSLNSIQWFKATAVLDGLALSEVSWKELPALTSTGKIHTTSLMLSPVRRGYIFSPDVSTFTPANRHLLKIFTAQHQQLEADLIMQLDFDGKIINASHPDQQYLYEHLTYATDDRQGTHAVFNGTSHYIDFGIPTGMDFQNITVSAWIRPTNLDESKSIIGIGEVFSAKVWNGQLTFTTPSIMDHRSDSALVTENEWQHVAWVFQAGKQLHFYYNGHPAGSTEASEINITSNSLLIGSNLWSEYFEGGMDDLYIWSRALSDEEILQVYKQDIDKKSIFSPYEVMIVVFIIALMSGIVIWFLFFRRKTKRSEHPSLTTPPPPALDNYTIHLRLFGGFQLINREGVDLTPKFSPRRKELFALILLHTFLDKGIATKTMSDMIWEGLSAENAKNNRSTQLKRIREILDDDTGITIDYQNHLWSVVLPHHVSCDFLNFKKAIIALQNGHKDDVSAGANELVQATKHGALLPDLDCEWLDKIKATVAEEIIDALTNLLTNHSDKLAAGLKIEICDAIFARDPINETALKNKIKAFIKDGKHSLAKATFAQFCNTYQNFYNEPYAGEFSDFRE